MKLHLTPGEFREVMAEGDDAVIRLFGMDTAKRIVRAHAWEVALAISKGPVETVVHFDWKERPAGAFLVTPW